MVLTTLLFCFGEAVVQNDILNKNAGRAGGTLFYVAILLVENTTGKLLTMLKTTYTATV